MQYRDFGRLDFKPSALGFGAMRLPVLSGEDGRPDFKRIDYELADAMLYRAIEGGVNYVDTAWMYHEQNSEAWLGRALQGGWRERVMLATKMPVWDVKQPSDFDRILAVQLERLQTDHIDFYLLHSLDAAHWRCVVEQDQLAAAERALADGRIRHLGFSFHGLYEDFEEILAATDIWEFVQIQYNYMDEDYQAGRKGLELAAGKGLGVIVMEPVRGGALANNVPPQVQEVWDEAPVERSPVAWALQWVWSHPEVSLLLSGMSTMAHVDENLGLAGESRPGLLTTEDLALVARARDLYRELSPIPCTACRYCMPCPQGVAIPEVFDLYNDTHMYSNLERAQFAYRAFWSDEERADRCTACGECVEKCPQGIDVPTWMEKAQAYLTGC
jgi:predicted aldo/keto reductase-like oxidoreductase